MNIKKIPVTIVSGFLGAGKTTLVNHLLAQGEELNIGVIVNEFGEVGVDGELILADENALIEIRNGCICCTVRTDLVSAVKELLAKSNLELDRLIVETSGLADPAPVLQTFLADAELLSKVELESVISVVDAVNMRRQLNDEIAREQIAFADLVVLNKSELVNSKDLELIEQDLRRINPTAKIIQTSNSVAPVEVLIGALRFSLPAILDIEPGLLGEEHDHEHDQSVSSCAAEVDSPIDSTIFNRWVNQLVQAHGEKLMRMKGILNIAGEARQFHFHSVHMLLDNKPGKRWPEGDQRKSRMVFIGKNLDSNALRDGFSACTKKSSLINHSTLLA